MMTATMTTTSIMLVRVIFSTSDADYTLESNCGMPWHSRLAAWRTYVAVTGYVLDLTECAHVIAKRLGFLSDIQVASRSLLFGLGV